jgi:spore maturation protein CgeB
VRFVIFTHSLVSDWNHGNAHFLRGLASEIVARGWELSVLEPRDGWSRQNLIQEHGMSAVKAFERQFPRLRSSLYDLASLDLDRTLERADAVLVHEWNDPELIARIGEHRARQDDGYRLFFHDTHHRAITSPEAMARFDLRNYDGVLAYGGCLREIYGRRPGIADAWTWHEAADIRTFYPRHWSSDAGDLVWIGNWGDDERAEELREFLIEPVKKLRLSACVYGVRYPDHALQELAEAGIAYRGWLPNYRVPEVFAKYRVTIHVPRRPYATALPGIPTIRPFEALACGIPMVSAPWSDCERLFRPGLDFLSARDGREMTDALRMLLRCPDLARSIAAHGLETIRLRHTCAHRIDELTGILREVREPSAIQGAA